MTNEMQNQSPTIAALSAALAKAQAKIGAADKDSTNPFLHNRYASLGSVIEAARQVLADNDLAVCQMPIGEQNSVGLETMLLHKSGEFVSRKILLPLGEEKGKSLAQVTGSIITYLRRYSLAAFLGIYTEEDDDGNDPPSPRPPASSDKSFSKFPPALAGKGTNSAAEIITKGQLQGLCITMRQNGWCDDSGEPLPESREYLGSIGYESRSQILAKDYATIKMYFNKRRGGK